MSIFGLGRSFLRRCISQPRIHNLSYFSTAQVNFTGDKTSPLDTNEKDTPVHPHLRPPRKLRQVANAENETENETEISTNQPRKRIVSPSDHQWPIVSFCTAAEYKLPALKKHLQGWKKVGGESLYQLADSFLTDELLENAVHYKVSRSDAEKSDDEQGDIFIFSEGSVVFWNVPKNDAKFFLKALQQFEVKPYPRSIVEYEAEYLHYSYMTRPDFDDFSVSDRFNKTEKTTEKTAKLTSDGKILLDKLAKNEPKFSLVKYAFSDAIAMSVKLATYESHLQQYVTSIENVAEDMKTKGRVSLTRDQVLRKTGELFHLRHAVNLGSNMLDPPDFYWDREDLESLYRLMCTYLNVNRRTKVINDKLSHCYALVEFFRDHLNNEKSVRLELWIIALITVEVVFEFLHFGQSYLATHPMAVQTQSSTSIKQ